MKRKVDEKNKVGRELLECYEDMINRKRTIKEE